MDLKPIYTEDLDDLKSMFVKNYPFDCENSSLLREKIFEESFLIDNGALKIEINGKLKGFILLTLRDIGKIKYGWIKFFCIDELNKNLDFANDILAYAEKRLIEKGAEAIRVFDTFPNYLWSGVDPRYTDYFSFFYYNGYEYYHDNVNLEVDLRKNDFKTLTEEKILKSEKGIDILRAGEGDEKATLDFIHRYFPNWDYEVRNMFRNSPPTIHLAVEGDEIVAFSGHNGNNFGTGWFGPMGTKPEKRGLGLGAVLLKRCLQDMKNEGLKKSTIPWVGPIGFYHRTVNAYVTRIFWQMRKIINKKKFLS